MLQWLLKTFLLLSTVERKNKRKKTEKTEKNTHTKTICVILKTALKQWERREEVQEERKFCKDEEGKRNGRKSEKEERKVCGTECRRIKQDPEAQRYIDKEKLFLQHFQQH